MYTNFLGGWQTYIFILDKELKSMDRTEIYDIGIHSNRRGEDWKRTSQIHPTEEMAGYWVAGVPIEVEDEVGDE